MTNYKLTVKKDMLGEVTTYLTQNGIAYIMEVNNDDLIITVDLSDEQAVALNDKFASVGAISFNGVLNSIVNATEYTVTQFVMPTAKAGLKVGGAIAKVGIIGATQGVASVVNVIADEGGDTINKVKSSAEVCEAKANLANGFNKLKGLFGSKCGIKITKA